MKRFHFNQDTGQVGVCDARIKCRLGMPLELHASTPEEASALYAATQETLPSPQRRGALPPPPDLTTAGVRASLGLQGVNLEASPSTPEQPLQEAPRNLPLGTGNLKARAGALEAALASGKKPQGFTLLGEGSQRRAYLHEESGVVFKVARGEDQELHERIAREEAASLRKLPLGTLAALDIEYAPTSFVKTPGGVIMVAQEYQHPVFVVPAEEHLTQEQFTLLDSLASRPQETGIYDFTYENVRFDTRRKRVVLLDCLYSQTLDRR